MTEQDNLAEAAEKLAQELENGANRIGGDWRPVLNATSRRIRALLQPRVDKAEAELAESRETIKRLNRRVQVAEAGVAEKVKASAPGSLGRALANAAASKAESELEALKARIAESAHVDVTLGCAIDGEIPPDLALCKVALVNVEK